MTSKKEIIKIGFNITNEPISKLPKKLDRVGFIIINTYQGSFNSLGDGPMNDGYTMADMLYKSYGYQIYYIVDTNKTSFLERLKYFLQTVENELVIYYVGHGTYVNDKNGDESDGYDEAMVFSDGNLIDDMLIKTVIEYKNENNKTVLVSDCCHSGSIWDIQSGLHFAKRLPSKIISISAATDKQTSKQTYIENREQGIFTYNMSKVLKNEPNLTPLQLKEKLTQSLKPYRQTITIATTSEEMLSKSLF